MPLCCWPWQGSRKCGSLEAKDSPAPSPEKPAPKPPEIKVSEAPEYGNGNPRNKCALQPGHSLMDWIRLGNSGKDLAGTGGRFKAVTPSELASHNQPENAWIAIRGKVYNIAAYLDYHPGGQDELMRGAGKDATQLFDQVHAWVNYESLLSKCLIGPLKSPQMSDEEFKLIFDSKQNSPKSLEKSKQPENLRKSMESLKSANINQNANDALMNSISDSEFATNKSSSESSLNVNESKASNRTSLSNSSALKASGVSIVISDEETKRKFTESPSMRFKYPTLTLTKADSLKSESDADMDEEERNAKAKQTPPKFDWIQKMEAITLIFYSKSFCNPQCDISFSRDKCSASITLTYDFHSFLFEISLENPVMWPCAVIVNYETGKVEINLRKETPKIWNGYGTTVKSDVIENSVKIDEENVNCVVVDKWEVNHNTSIVLLKCIDDRHLTFPIGYHCRIFSNVEELLSRAYTPIPGYLMSEFIPNKWSSNLLCMMVKKYEQGAVSTWITSRKIGDELVISRPLGSFLITTLQDISQMYLIAAGTGLTPMLSLIQFALQRRNPRCTRIDLLFFNRSEKDILWHDQLAMLASKDDRFHLTNVLSAPSYLWTGLKGHINQAVLKNHLHKTYLEESEMQLNESTDSNKTTRSIEQFFSDNHGVFISVCGPSPFTQLTRTLLTGLGCSEDKLHCFLG